MNYLYSELNIEPEFYKKKSEKKPYINLNYGWAYKISDKLSAGALCDKCNRTLRGDFRTMSEYSHGTSIYLKVFDFTNHEHIMNMISFLYFRLFEVVNIYCLDTIGSDYNNARYELDEIFEQYWYSYCPALVIVYDQNQEDQYINVKFPERAKFHKEKYGEDIEMRTSCEIPEIGFKIHTRCFACRVDEAGQLQSLQREDSEIVMKYLAE